MGVKERILGIFSKSLDEALIEDEPVAAVTVADKAPPDPDTEPEKKAEPAAPDLAARFATLEAGFETLQQAIAKLAGLNDEPKAEATTTETTAAADCACTDPDIIARAEILAPGIAKVGDVKSAALKTAYGTEDGKSAIDVLLGGRSFDSADKDMMFIAASEMLKTARAGRINTVVNMDGIPRRRGPLTPEEINELNAKHYGAK